MPTSLHVLLRRRKKEPLSWPQAAYWHHQRCMCGFSRYLHQLEGSRNLFRRTLFNLFSATTNLPLWVPSALKRQPQATQFLWPCAACAAAASRRVETPGRYAGARRVSPFSQTPRSKNSQSGSSCEAVSCRSKRYESALRGGHEKVEAQSIQPIRNSPLKIHHAGYMPCNDSNPRQEAMPTDLHILILEVTCAMVPWANIGQHRSSGQASLGTQTRNASQNMPDMTLVDVQTNSFGHDMLQPPLPPKKNNNNKTALP